MSFKGFNSKAESECSRIYSVFPPKPEPKEGFISCVFVSLAIPFFLAALSSLLIAMEALLLMS
jgi:hypothetical protein